MLGSNKENREKAMLGTNEREAKLWTEKESGGRRRTEEREAILGAKKEIRAIQGTQERSEKATAQYYAYTAVFFYLWLSSCY